MSQPLISVIVPVYKAERYFEECVNSIRNQTYKNLEIILVDDGSPDRCGQMCDAFALQDSRIRVIHKENGGQSTARNAGLDIATGEYIGFVDSDDRIEPDMYSHLYELLTSHNAQIAACGVQQDFSDGTHCYFNPDYPAQKQIECFSKVEALRQCIVNHKVTNSLCDKLFAQEIFQGNRMLVGIIYEDMELIPRCLERIDRMVYDPTPYYHYNQTDTSTTRGAFTPENMRVTEVAYARVTLFAKKYPELYPEAMAYYISLCLYVIGLSKSVVSCTDQRNALIRQLRGKLPADAVKVLSRKDRIKLSALRAGTPVFDALTALIALKKGKNK